MEAVKSMQEKAFGKDDEKRTSFWNVDKNMIPYKIHFFLYVGAMGALLPFHPTIGITRFGLGASHLALVYTTLQFLLIVLKPIIGYIVDYSNNLKAMILILTVTNCLLSYLLLFVPTVEIKSYSVSNETRLQLLTNLCDVCHISSRLERIMMTLPESTDLPRENCEKPSSVSCVQTNQNSSISFNSESKICLETCHFSGQNQISKSGENFTNDSRYYFILHVTVNGSYDGKNRFTIVCSSRGNVTQFEKLNLTLDYVVESCYRYHSHAIPTAKTPDLICGQTSSNNVTCSNLELKGKGETEDEINIFRTYQFWLYALLIIISSTCTSAIFTLSDTACYESVHETGADYGMQRAWGSIGWGLMAPFAGFLNDYTDSYFSAMILMTVLSVLQIWNLYKMKLVKPQISQNILKDVKTVLSSTEFIAFDIGVFFNGMAIGIVWYYLAWFVADIGGSRLLLGLAHTMQCFLGELPFMLISGWLIKKLGHFNVITMAITAHCVRFIGYSYLKNPWMILPIECLDGITFGLFYTAMTSYGKRSSRPGTEATTQSLLCSTYEGLGAGLGCVISGVAFDYYGGYTTFFYAGLCCAVAAAVNISSTLLLRCRKSSFKVSGENVCETVRY